MTNATKQDIENLTTAVVEGFQAVHERFDAVDATLDQHGKMIDHIAGRVDDLWTENGAQVIANRRMDARLTRIEQVLDLEPIQEEIAA